jgi:GNAT superfamily N-acetyltransferase
MTIVWTDDCAGVDWHELEALYRAAPLGNKNAADLEVVFGNSMFSCFARDNGRLVGAGRVLADGRDCAYLCDVAVLPSHQGTGLGKQIIERLLAKSQGHAKIILCGRRPRAALCEVWFPADEDGDGDFQEPAIGDRQGAIVRELIVGRRSNPTRHAPRRRASSTR